jgi:hypothetical protein
MVVTASKVEKVRVMLPKFTVTVFKKDWSRSKKISRLRLHPAQNGGNSQWSRCFSPCGLYDPDALSASLSKVYGPFVMEAVPAFATHKQVAVVAQASTIRFPREGRGLARYTR